MAIIRGGEQRRRRLSPPPLHHPRRQQHPQHIIKRRPLQLFTVSTILFSSINCSFGLLHSFPLRPVNVGGVNPLSASQSSSESPITTSTFSFNQQRPRPRTRHSFQLSRRPKQSSTQLCLLPTTIAATASILGSSLMGQSLDEKLQGGGILVTLLSAALLSNLKLAPQSHMLYDWCWSIFLPASLSYLLLAYPMDIATTSDDEEEGTPSIASSIAKVGTPFLLASLSSLIGCWMSYKLITGLNLLSITHAQAATACLSASLVGGSVNFFATALHIQAPSSLLGALATSDLLTMAIYFGFLAYALTSPLFRKFYHVPNENNDHGIKMESDGPLQEKTKDVETIIETSPPPRKAKPILSISIIATNTLAALLISSLGLGIVHLANVIDRIVGRWIPGMACAVIAVVAPLLNKCITHQYHSKSKSYIATLWNRMQSIGRTLSDITFHFLFAAIGISANLQQAMQTGPACLLFASTAYLLHVVFTLASTHVLQRSGKIFQTIELEDVLIASNAAIGGPATAATFCSRMRHSPKRLGWTLAASTWGVVGYAIGTVVGIGMYNLITS